MSEKEVRVSIGYQIVEIMRRNPDKIFTSKELARRIKGQTVFNISNNCRNLVKRGYIDKVPMEWGNKGRVGYIIVMERGFYPRYNNLGKIMRKTD